MLLPPYLHDPAFYPAITTARVIGEAGNGVLMHDVRGEAFIVMNHVNVLRIVRSEDDQRKGAVPTSTWVEVLLLVAFIDL